MKIKVATTILYFPFTFFSFFIVRQFNQSTLILEQITCISLVYLVFVFSYAYKVKAVSINFVSFILVSVLAYGQLVANIPLNIDRSRSFYVLGWVKSHQIEKSVSGITLRYIQSKEKKPNSAIEQRIEEHISRGIFRVNKNNVLELSTSGSILYYLSEASAEIFNLNGWKVNSK